MRRVSQSKSGNEAIYEKLQQLSRGSRLVAISWDPESWLTPHHNQPDGRGILENPTVIDTGHLHTRSGIAEPCSFKVFTATFRHPAFWWNKPERRTPASLAATTKYL
jgi:hypothetical protein